MGRKPKAAKVEEKAQTVDSRSVPKETDEVLPEGIKLLADGLQAQPENVVVLLEKVVPLQKSVDPSSGGTDSLPKQKGKTAKLSNSKRSPKKYTSHVRRSGRLKSIMVPARNNDIVPAFEDLIGSDSENEDEPPLPGDVEMQKPNLDELSIEEKTNYLIKRVEALESSIQALNAKVNGEFCMGGSTYSADTENNYVHLECEKKIQALISENHLLRMRLENAVKLEVYERGNCLFSEMLEKMKDIVLLFNQAKPSETSGNGEEQDAVGHTTSSKRKRRMDEI